jgi:hypothetical protein
MLSQLNRLMSKSKRIDARQTEQAQIRKDFEKQLGSASDETQNLESIMNAYNMLLTQKEEGAKRRQS